MNQPPFEIVTGDQVDPSLLTQFLQRVYRPEKSEFIAKHGPWLYRGAENQWIVLEQPNTIVAYCAVIPTACLVQDTRVPALWWVDLIVDPAYRGRGIQSLIDERLRAHADLKLGIPNALAAKIHRKHNWGVREDGQVLLMPLRPLGVKQVQSATGRRRLVLGLGALALTPLAALWRGYLGRQKANTAKQVDTPHVSDLVAIFEHHKRKMPVTTYRDEAFIQWRYLDSPHRNQLRIYTAGGGEVPTCCLIARYVTFRNVKAVRIVDLFGDLTDLDCLRDIMLLAARDAADWGATQLTILSFLSELIQPLRRLGFLVTVPSRFCWHSQDRDLMRRFDNGLYWTIGDSDNDEPE